MTKTIDELQEIYQRAAYEAGHKIQDTGHRGAILAVFEAGLADEQEHSRPARDIAEAAIAYKHAADEAYAVQRVNGRRGASAAAVDQVNRYRARAKEAHERLLATIATLEEGGEQP